MKCQKCHTENSATRKFCRECGAKLVIVCPQCRTENLPDDKFCGECGYNINKLKQEPSIDYSEPQSYTPKYLADKILTTRSTIEGERKLVTVLFADVAGYTAMSEKLDPEEVHLIMNGCFKILMDEIHKFEGTINQFTGDGIMALFGAPVAHEDHSQRCCYAALSIQKAMRTYSDKINNEFGVDFKMRIGINSGPVVVASIGDDLRMDYTAVGDTTNLASRMENIAGPGTSLVSEHTYRLARDFFEFKFQGKVEVKGKEQPQEIYELIKTGRAESRIDASVAKGLTKFVGRSNSMSALMGAYEKARIGSGQVVGVVGDAGVGKSRLLLEFRNRLPHGDFAYFEGRCLHFGGAMAFLPIVDIIRTYFEIEEGDQEIVIKERMLQKILQLGEKLHGVLSPFYELLSLNLEDEAYQQLEPSQKRERIFEAIRDVLIRESQNRTVILVIEDLHWIDKSSEEFLDYLIGWLTGARILLLLLYRPEYTHPWGSKSYYNRIGLDQLTAISSNELIQAILSGAEPVAQLKEIILNRAAGNPLYMEELTHTLLENGAIQCQDDKCVLMKKPSEIQVPDSIQGIIAARMDRLNDDLKRTMQIASVIGRDFAFRILETVTEMKKELKSCLLNLQGLEFIYEKNLFPELEYVFKHALTQEVAYNSLLQKRRKEIHEKIGRAVEELWPDRMEEFYEMLAYHYSKSENLEKSCEYLKLSGNKAMKNYSNWEAFRYFKETLHVLTDMPENEEIKRAQIEVCLLLANPMLHLGFPEDSLEILQTGERLTKELGDEKNLAHFLSLIGQYHAWKGEDLILAIQYSEDSFKEAKKIQDIELMAPIGADLSMLYFWMGEFFKVIDVSSEVIFLLEKTQKQAEFFGRPYNVYAFLLAQHSVCVWRLGNFEEGSALFERGLDFALEIKDLFALSLLELHHGMNHNFKGDAKNALAHLQNSIKYAEEGQNVSFYGVAWIGLGWAYWLRGEVETARSHMEKALKIQMESGIHYDLSFFYAAAGMVDLDCGDLKTAQYRAEQALKTSQKNHQQYGEGMAWILLGRTLGKADVSQIDKAEAWILQGTKILAGLKLVIHSSPGYYFLGELFADIGRLDKALENFKKAVKQFREMGMDYWVTKTHKALDALSDGAGEIRKMA